MTRKSFFKKNPLFFAFAFPAFADGTLTLIGQDQSYWTKRMVNEGSPAYYFLLASPWAFIAGSIVWFVGWYWIFRRLKEPINIFLMFLFIAGHSWGSTSWIWHMMKTYGVYTLHDQLSIILVWSFAVVYLMLIALWATYCVQLYFKRR